MVHYLHSPSPKASDENFDQDVEDADSSVGSDVTSNSSESDDCSAPKGCDEVDEVFYTGQTFDGDDHEADAGPMDLEVDEFYEGANGQRDQAGASNVLELGHENGTIVDRRLVRTARQIEK